MSIEATLGTLSVRSKSGGLELTVSSAIQCTASEEDEAEELQRRLTTPQLNNDSISKPFLYCGSSLMISISLYVKAALSVEQLNGVIETFSSQLRTAMLWQQLLFSPPAIRTSPTENDRTLIEVTLTTAAQASDDSQRMQHKLGVGVPFNDVRPPPGVLAATLDNVVLDVRIQHGLESQNESAKTTNVTQNANSAADTQTIQITHAEELDCIPTVESRDGLQLDLGVCETAAVNELLFPLDSEAEEVDSVSSEMLLKANDSSSQTIDHLLSMLDAAIRRAISLSSGPIAKGTRVVDDKAFISLSSVAPALFRQHHLPAVASRAIFIPTISKSISAIHSRQAGSKLMECRAGCTSHRSVFTFRSNDTKSNGQQDTRTCIHEQTKRVPQLLWLTIDRGLLGLNPERRLKPLSMDFTDSHCLNLNQELLGVQITPDKRHLAMERFESDNSLLYESFEDDWYSDYEEMLDDIGAFSDHGSDFGSDFAFHGGDGYDSQEELHWDHEHLPSDCHQDDNNHTSYYDDDVYMPGDVAIGEDPELVCEGFGAISWRAECKAPSSTGSLESLAFSDDEMLGI